jgi:hypothetical protein
MYNDEMCPGHLVARHMARRRVLITDGTANSACTSLEGPFGRELDDPTGLRCTPWSPTGRAEVL